MGGTIIKELPGLLGSGTLCITNIFKAESNISAVDVLSGETICILQTAI
jgi:hypothetical protein